MTVTDDDLRGRVADLLASHPPATTDRLDFLRARFDAGLAWVWFPEGLGGLGLPRAMQQVVERDDDGPDGWFFRTALVVPF